MEIKYKNGNHILSVKPFKLIEITDKVVVANKLDNVAKVFDKKYILNKSIMVENLIRYNVDGNWVDRLIESEKYGRDSSSLESLICRYGGEVGHKLFEDKVKKSTVTEQYYINKYGKVDGPKRWMELCKSKATFTSHYYINKYGEDDGRRLWKNVVDRKVKNWTKNLKSGKFKTWLTLEEYQQRHGVELGYKKWNDRAKLIAYKSSLQYYIDTYGNELGRVICKDNKNNTSLDKFIDRYGTVDGKIRYDVYCKKCAITLPKMIGLYGAIDGTRRYLEWREKISNSSSRIGVSKSSQDLFWGIYEKIEESDREYVYFYELNNEYKFFHHLPDVIKLYMVDFKLKNKIIEFDCDYWHNSENDKIRDTFLNSKGYTVLRVNYVDYVKNKKQLLNKCINYLYG